MFQDTSASIVQRIEDDLFKKMKVELFIKRDDLLHPYVSGNKWRKLKYNIEEAQARGHTQLLTFGGAYSNHILATAAAANMVGLKSIGIIRGEEVSLDNPTLSRALKEGMVLKRISRTTYKDKHNEDFISGLRAEYGDFYHIPEGGSNVNAVLGVSELMGEIPHGMDYVVAAVGTGATLAGIINGASTAQEVIGIPVLKGAGFLEETIRQFIIPQNKTKWSLIHDYHFNGYAKFNPELIQFINNFKRSKDVPLDPIYTGKMIFGVFSLIERGFFVENSKILVIHTGGLQGIDGFNKTFDEKVF